MDHVMKNKKEILKVQAQLKEEHEYFSKQFKLMASLLQDMQNKCDYFFNKQS
jgi:hypothetical protein